jgi:hypothetical protein
LQAEDRLHVIYSFSHQADIAPHFVVLLNRPADYFKIVHRHHLPWLNDFHLILTCTALLKQAEAGKALPLPPLKSLSLGLSST